MNLQVEELNNKLSTIGTLESNVNSLSSVLYNYIEKYNVCIHQMKKIDDVHNIFD